MATEKIKLVRLTSGEEIIGKVTEHYGGTDKTTSIEIKDGVCLIAAEEGRLGFMPYMPYTKAHKGVWIRMEHVVFIVDPADEVKDRVQEMTSGIVRADASMIQGVK